MKSQWVWHDLATEQQTKSDNFLELNIDINPYIERMSNRLDNKNKTNKNSLPKNIKIKLH